jgi:2-polyprenyl-3-methyl-5-hydroxy-6-metoxy-1,4-benzoquinol methylase
MSCPACGATSSDSNSSIIVCRICGHRWLNLTQEDHRAVEAATFTHDYVGYRADYRYIESTTRIGRSQLIPRVPPPGRVLDVGCGAGDFMMVAQTFGYEVEGIDISNASAEMCRARDLNARAADFLTCDFDSNFDLITLWDVVAHLRNPAAFLGRAHSLLTERGLLFIKTPAFGELSVMLSKGWPRLARTLLGAPSHVQYFDRESLSALLLRTGFKPEWIDAGQARSLGAGGSLKRRLARHVRRGISRLSGDLNLYVVGHPLR